MKELPSPESAEFFLATLGSFIRGEPAKPGPCERLDWGYLSALVRAHGLGAVFLHVHAGGGIPPEVSREWKSAETKCLIRNLQSLKTAVRIFAAFESAGIPAAGMRGLVLAHGMYPNPAMRLMKDVDILIRPGDCDRVLQTLETLGLAPQKILRSQYVYLVNGTEIELHWSFLTPKRYRKKFNADRLLAGRRSLHTPDGEIFRLSDEDELLGLVAHAFIHHDLGDLHSLVDIALYMRREEIDWPALARWSREAKLTRMFLFTLGLADHLFNLQRQDILHEFGGALSPFMQGSFDSYISPFFARARLSQLLRQKAMGVYLAEEPSTKIRQLLRYCSKKDIQDLWRRSYGTARPSNG